MAKKAKTRKAPTQGIKSTKDIDALGAFRKGYLNGIPVADLVANNIPRRLKRQFVAAVKLNNDTIKRSVMKFMEGYVATVERKFKVDLDIDTTDEELL